jgi:Dictyostelium (Slime Mold) REP protein
VYPKDGSEARKASFTGSFGDDEVNDDNNRYIFPAGCEAPKLIQDQSKKNSRQGIIDALNKNLNGETARGSRNRSAAPRPTTTTTSTTTTTTTAAPTTTEQIQEIETTPNPNNNQAKNEENSGENKDNASGENDNSETDDQRLNDAEDDDTNSDNEDDGSCCKADGVLINMTCAKILIPINKRKLSSIPTSEIMAVSSLKSTLSILQGLQELAEKYDL